LARSIVYLMTLEFGKEEVIKRLSDPLYFQSLGCLLGFDWHSSGLTTTLTYALKRAIYDLGGELGIFAAGGKGKFALRVPEEIRGTAERFGFDPTNFVYASRMSAKVDSCLLQDNYQLYHHTIFYTKNGLWCVVQQGMNPDKKLARRYHWLSEKVDSFVREPHAGIMSERREREVLDLTSNSSKTAQEVILDLVKEPPDKVVRLYTKALSYKLPARHYIVLKDIRPENFKRILLKTYMNPPRDFEELTSFEGLGPMSMRALALISDVIYGTRPSYQDPVVYSFAHGGKDGYPYRVRRDIYDKSIEVLERAIKLAKLGQRDELIALRKLQKLFGS